MKPKREPVNNAEANRAGRQSKQAALACAIKHWQNDLYAASLTELQELETKDIGPEGPCALCRRYGAGNCRNCPLAVVFGLCSCRDSNKWKAARDAHAEALKVVHNLYLKHAKWLAWRTAARAMTNQLIQVWNGLYKRRHRKELTDNG